MADSFGINAAVVIDVGREIYTDAVARAMVLGGRVLSPSAMRSMAVDSLEAGRIFVREAEGLLLSLTVVSTDEIKE